MIQLVLEEKPRNVLSVNEWRDNGEIVIGIELINQRIYILERENQEFVFRAFANPQNTTNDWRASRKELIGSFLCMKNREVIVFNKVYEAMKFLQEKMGAELDKQSKKM